MHFSNSFPRAIAGLVAAALVFLTPGRASAVTVPFTEAFATNAAGWVIGLVPSGTGSPTWSGSGGVDNGGFISLSRTMSTSQFTGLGFGSAMFRGNADADASGDAFVGNWLPAGVSAFSAAVRHDAPAALNMYLRIDVGGGAAASSVVFSVPSKTWTTIGVPIVDGTSSFQSYGNGTFSSVFSNVQNVQFWLAPNQPAEVLDGVTSYTFGLDNVSAVPEPSAIALAATALGCVAGIRLRRRGARCSDELNQERSRSA